MEDIEGGECVENDMKVLGFHPELAVFRDKWRDLIYPNLTWM